MPSRPTFAQTLAASSSNAVLPMQCDEFLIQAQICKNTGGVRAHCLQKYERYSGKNTSANSKIFFKNGKNCFFNNAEKFQNTFLIL